MFPQRIREFWHNKPLQETERGDAGADASADAAQGSIHDCHTSLEEGNDAVSIDYSTIGDMSDSTSVTSVTDVGSQLDSMDSPHNSQVQMNPSKAARPALPKMNSSPKERPS